MSLGSALFLAALFAAFAFFIRSSMRLLKFLSIGKEESRLDNLGARIQNVLLIAFG